MYAHLVPSLKSSSFCSESCVCLSVETNSCRELKHTQILARVILTDLTAAFTGVPLRTSPITLIPDSECEGRSQVVVAVGAFRLGCALYLREDLLRVEVVK